MADDKLFDDDAPENENQGKSGSAGDDSGLGNLPPLSEFDSQQGFDSDGDLPPLGDFESQDSSVSGGGGFGAAESSKGGIDDIGSLGFASEMSDKDSSGFQDLAADSDFSPETPDIGPGPDSSLDTPIFDSAFGGDDSGFGVDQTSTATQAMETPIFDSFSEGLGETPVPDFSPDTGFAIEQGGGFDDEMAVPAGAAAGVGVGVAGDSGTKPTSVQAPGRRGTNPLLVIGFSLAALLIGIITSPYFSEYLSFLPNPLLNEISQRDGRIAELSGQLSQARQLQGTDEEPVVISEGRIAELQEEILTRSQELEAIDTQIDSTRSTLDTQQEQLRNVERDLSARNDEVVAAREFLDELRNETAIVQARQRGLVAEVDRLTGYVGELDEANTRRVATKEALEHNIDRLAIKVKESIDLAPEKYDYATRLAAVTALRDKVAQAPWVTPDLQNEYTSHFLREMELAQASDYFFARIPVTDRYGHRSYKWAECLMRGNWSVLYRTLDGAHIGSYENVGAPETPIWGFREDLPADIKRYTETAIINARAPDFEGQVQVIAEREQAGKEGTVWQRAYSSL